ncbi:DNA repair protein RadC [Chitinophaga sp. CF118]|uniref:RadC family protein n=1 Tax=Chitinophaga sp. CF118 TaxID=1884367 RepID=UPI0008F049DA|nr:DNA repair protein RadC [Chitinophaga sp. CF118]SFE79383.1 DNA repair protein RadC [Chitinophaga sp. CF118]
METVVTQSPHISIRNWANDDKPREKLMNKGVNALSDAELLAILLNNGHKQKSAIELAQEVLRSAASNLCELGKQSVSQLKKIRGIGNAKAITIIAAVELSRRRQASYTLQKKTISNGSEAALYFKPLIGDNNHESFHVMYLNNASKIIRISCVSKGGITNTFADPRVIFKEALELEATRIILCHNHPSGSLRPSNADISITKKIKEAGLLLDITVLDHIIVSEAGYCSMVEDGFII